MDTFIIYIIKSAICFTIFYVCVKAFLSNETFFRFNRRVIMFGTLVCLLLPLIQIKVTTDKDSIFQAPIAILERTLTEAVSISRPTPVIETNVQEITASGKYENQNSTSVKIDIILLYIYIAGMVVNLFILSRSAYLMASLIRKGKKQYYSNYTLVLISEDIVPFSWGKYIVLSILDYKNNPDEIITHEIAHARHRHSIDLIFMELVLLLQWFNPAMWLLKRELKDIHEYQADTSVLQSGINVTKYQLLLVKKAVGASSYTLANSFNHSKIKKRITMMLKEKSNKWARLRLLLLLPLGTLTVFAFARPEVTEPINSIIEYESTKILPEIEKNVQKTETQQQKEKIKTNRYKYNYYLVDGQKVSIDEYEKIKENSLDIMTSEYIPFAKGKVITVLGVFDSGEKDGYTRGQTYMREMFVDGKAPDRSHVYFIVNDVKYSYEEGWNKSSGVKYKTLEEAKKHSKNPIKCQIVSKDGNQSSAVFYTVPFTPPIISADSKEKKNTSPSEKVAKQSGSKKTVKFAPPVIQSDTAPKRKVVFVPPAPPVKTTKQSGEKKTVKFAPPVIKKDNPKSAQKKTN